MKWEHVFLEIDACGLWRCTGVGACRGRRCNNFATKFSTLSFDLLVKRRLFLTITSLLAHTHTHTQTYWALWRPSQAKLAWCLGASVSPPQTKSHCGCRPSCRWHCSQTWFSSRSSYGCGVCVCVCVRVCVYVSSGSDTRHPDWSVEVALMSTWRGNG